LVSFGLSAPFRHSAPFPFLVLILLAIFLFASASFDAASAATRKVPSEYKTIQRAIDAAAAGDTILVGPGLYKENLILRVSASLIGTRGAAKTIIDGGGRASVLTCEGLDSTATIKGFTFRNGVGLEGGGMLLSNAFPSVVENVFTADSAVYGGALCALWSNSIIRNNKFVANRAQYGAAIYTMLLAPTIESNVVENNVAKIGGAFYFGKSSEVKVIKNTLANNEATETGGAIFCGKAIPTMDSNVFKTNKAHEGGAIYSFHCSGIIKGNLFLENVALRGGAMAFADTMAPDIRNNTIVRNSSPDSLCAGMYFSSSYSNVTNNIIASNSPGYAIYCVAGGAPVLSCNILWENRTGNYSGVESNIEDIYEDPQFCAPGKGDFSVKGNSPALTKPCGAIGAYGKGCGKGPGS